MSTLTQPRQRGFTLIEMIAVVVLLGIAAATIISMQGNILNPQRSVDLTTAQVYSRLQQACAEQVLLVERQDGIDQVTNVSVTNGGSGRFGTNNCDALVAYGSNPIPSVTVNDNYTGSACPTGVTCKLVTVQEGSLPPLVFMLADY